MKLRFFSILLVSVFLHGALLALLSSPILASGATGQGHPGVEICDDSLCVLSGKVGVGTRTPSTTMTVYSNQGEILLDGPNGIPPSIRYKTSAGDLSLFAINGKFSIGPNSNTRKLSVSASNVEIDGVPLSSLAGSNPVCTTGDSLAKKWKAKTCSGSKGGTCCLSANSCTTPVKWSVASASCTHKTATYDDSDGSCLGCGDVPCFAVDWSDVFCVG